MTKKIKQKFGLRGAKLIKVSGVGFVGDYVRYRHKIRRIIKANKRHTHFYVR